MEIMNWGDELSEDEENVCNAISRLNHVLTSSTASQEQPTTDNQKDLTLDQALIENVYDARI